MINVGVIGCGYWGPNLVRNFNACEGARMAMVSDLRPERLAFIASRYPAATATADCGDILGSPQIDAVAIATPAASHHELARRALMAGKHVLVEKPLCMQSAQAEELIALAESRGLTLMVDHTFVYTGAVAKIRELIAGGELGELLYYDSCRVNLGLFQSDVSVIWDLAIHDLSILDHLVAARPVAVSATGLGHIPGAPDNIAYLTLFFANSFIAHVNVNWLAPVKVRRTLIGGSRRMVVFDDLDPSEMVKVYDKGVTVTERPEDMYEMLISYRTGDMLAPRLDRTEALAREVRHFVDCVETGATPLSDGRAALRVVKILEAASLSMQRRGESVPLDLGRA